MYCTYIFCREIEKSTMHINYSLNRKAIKVFPDVLMRQNTKMIDARGVGYNEGEESNECFEDRPTKRSKRPNGNEDYSKLTASSLDGLEKL